MNSNILPISVASKVFLLYIYTNVTCLKRFCQRYNMCYHIIATLSFWQIILSWLNHILLDVVVMVEKHSDTSWNCICTKLAYLLSLALLFCLAISVAVPQRTALDLLLTPSYHIPRSLGLLQLVTSPALWMFSYPFCSLIFKSNYLLFIWGPVQSTNG